VTTKEIRQLISSLKEVIAYQTTVIESTKAELLEVKHDQNVLRDQNEKLYDEIRTLRERIETLTPVTEARSWAAVAASGSISSPQSNHQRPEKERNCVRISTQRSFVDPSDNDNIDGNTFGRYSPRTPQTPIYAPRY
jgi:septal ring factor EnvC (AmiA/AmiB activator)